MKVSFKEYKIISEAGQDAGKLELVKTDVKTAEKYAQKSFEKHGKVLEEEIPDFKINYKTAQKAAAGGKTKRKDMPVIDENDVRQLQARLKTGAIDVNDPFTKENVKNPFPKGLSGKEAEEWLVAGLKDGDSEDDKVSAKMEKVTVKDLKPIQKQIYFDKSIDGSAEFGAKGTRDFLTKNSTFIVSADNYIIDGHHRFLSGLLIDPNMKVNCLVIDLPISTFLPMALSYSDAIGNKRNESINEAVSVKIGGKKITAGDDILVIDKSDKDGKFAYRLGGQNDDGDYVFRGVSTGADYNPWASAMTKTVSKKDLKKLKLFTMDDETKSKNSRSRSAAFSQAMANSEIGAYS